MCQLRHELDRVRNERDRMLQENSDIGRDKSDADAEKLRLKVRPIEIAHEAANKRPTISKMNANSEPIFRWSSRI